MFESLLKQSELLRKEYEFEKAAYLEAVRRAPLNGEVAEGDCWYPIRLGNTSYNIANQLVVDVFYDGALPEESSSDFEPGKIVNFFSIENGQMRVLNYNCVVSSIREYRMEVSVNNMPTMMALQNLASRGSIGVLLGIDDYTYQVMQSSLRQVKERNDEDFVHLRSVLIGEAQPSFRDLRHTSMPWLNASQNAAVAKVLNARETAIVHGPPGTGKTTTLVEAISETLKRELQVLVCAPSNAAVDWISEQLFRRGIPVLRIGNPLRINDVMMQCSYEYRYANHPDYLELFGVRSAIREIKSHPRLGEKEHNQIRKLQHREMELEVKIREELFANSGVIACTLIGSANRLLERRHFGTVFIDEAAQALEAACWTAILKADRVVFAGDHQQLPPTVKCKEAGHEGLERTLMQKVVKSKPSCVTLLDVQYRMNQDIMEFSSRHFYHGKLKADPSVAERLVSPIDKPLMWIDTSLCDFGEQQSRSLSRSNHEEAKLLMKTLMDYVKLIGMEHLLREQTDFGIISPYKAQVRLLRKYLRNNKMLKPLRHQISVNTVDGFQGQERDVILISMVRDNESGNIGFLNDLRRMNVAITRARMKLIIFGNAETLSKTKFYEKLVAYFEDRGDFVKVNSFQETLDK
jgi:superfamily I DNA and/or RNA helicase